MVTATVVAPRAVPLTTRLIPVPVEPAAGEVIATRGRGAFAAWAPASGQTTKAVSSAVRTQTARREIGKRIRPPTRVGSILTRSRDYFRASDSRSTVKICTLIDVGAGPPLVLG